MNDTSVAAGMIASFSPSVQALAQQLAGKLGRPGGDILKQLAVLGTRMSVAAVEQAARLPYAESDLALSVVRDRARAAFNRTHLAQTHCSGGQTVIEIAPNGDYARCPKLLHRRILLGNVRDDEPLRLLDPRADDMRCSAPCPPLMCVSRNVVRARGGDVFERMVDGRRHGGGAPPGMLVRWNLTNVCNYSCPYCVAGHVVNKRAPEMSDQEVLQTAEKLCDQIPRMSLRLTGGEPSVRRAYVGMFDIFYDRLASIGEIEVRTNLSFDDKVRAIVGGGRDWGDKLLFHISCHIQDRNFRPWRYIDILLAGTCRYALKFVATPQNRTYVDRLRRYFLDAGVPAANIKVIDRFDGAADDSGFDYAAVPPAIVHLQSSGAMAPAVAA